MQEFMDRVMWKENVEIPDISIKNEVPGYDGSQNDIDYESE